MVSSMNNRYKTYVALTSSLNKTHFSTSHQPPVPPTPSMAQSCLASTSEAATNVPGWVVSADGGYFLERARLGTVGVVGARYRGWESN